MPLPLTAARALADADLRFEEDVPLDRKAWWRVGGPADAWLEVHTVEELARAQRAAEDAHLPVTVLGNGSNILVSDGGVRGLVLHLDGDLAEVDAGRISERQLTVGAGMKLTVLLHRAQRAGWTGLESIAGIPGTIGGAVRMNAGSTLGEIGDALLHVEVVHRDGRIETLDRAALRLAYRTCHLPEGAIVATATFRLGDEDPAASAERVRTFIERRKATQPLDKPSCGSTFRNPPGDAAGRLIEAAGLKGFTIGGAQVSTKHANFIVNLGDASAQDIRDVIETVQRRVSDQFGVTLEREVHFVGDWSGAAR